MAGICVLCAALAAFALSAALSPPSPAPLTLTQVLASLDRAAPNIHTVSARVSVDDYTALVQDSSRSNGTFAYERGRHGPRYELNLTTPAASAKRLVYRDRTAWVYTPASRQVLKYSLAGKQELVDRYLTLGIGATGRELSASFHVALDGEETLDGVPAVKLTLTPLHPSPGSKITHIDLWYNRETWVAAQQQIWMLGGDYHRVRYRDVKINTKLDDHPFSTHFPGATVVTPSM